MTDAQLNEILAYCEAATPGPWENQEATGIDSHWFDVTVEQTISEEDPWDDEVASAETQLRRDIVHKSYLHKHDKCVAQIRRNLDFIARARTDLPAVVRELQEARKEIQEWEQSNKVSQRFADIIEAQASEIESLRTRVQALTRRLYPAEPAAPKHSATPPVESKSGS